MQQNFSHPRREFLRFLAASPYVAALGGAAAFLEQHAMGQSAQNAAEVLKITDVAFREGATTNLELIDAQRRARDSDITAALAEDRVRQSRLDLLVALGQFPK